MTLPNTAEPAVTPPPTRSGNGFGLAALIVAIVAIVLSFIPVIGVFAMVLAVVAIILGMIALTRRGRKKGAGIAGLILGIVALLIAIIVTAITAAVVGSVNDSVNKTTTHTIVYSVTGDGKKADVTYEQFQGDTSKSVQHSEKVPFTKTLKITEKGTINLNSFSVSATYPISTSTGKQLGKKLACTVTIDGKVKGSDSASGSGVFVNCNGSAG